MTLDPSALGWQWEVADPRPSGASAPPSGTVVWRLEVTGPPPAWTTALEARRAALLRVVSRQEVAAARLAAFVAAPAPLSFAGGPGPATPETELAGLLAGSPGPTGLAFGPLQGLQDRWGSLVGRLEAALARLTSFLHGSALVETVITHHLVAQTTIDLDGDLRTAWRTDVSGAAATLHAGAIETAQAARRQAASGLRLLFEGAALLVTLPVLATNPAGLLIALPAVWRFIERVTDDAEPA